MEKSILVVDVGTSKVHTNLFNIISGELIECIESPYKWIHPREGWTEINPNSIWKAAEDAVGEIIYSCNKVADIVALAFSYIGDSLIPVDKDQNVLGNMILAFDNRAEKEAEIIKKEFGEKKFFDITGNVVRPQFIPAKILWLKNNQPDIFERAAYFQNIQQFINIKLGLAGATDYTLASRKVIFDSKRMEWSKELCEFLDINPEALGENIKSADTIIGTIKKFGKAEFEKPIPVILGAHDSESGLIGLGCIPGNNKVLGNVTGTYDHIGYFIDKFPTNLETGIGYKCGPLEGSFVLMGASIAGPNLDWFVNTFYKNEGVRAIDRLFNEHSFEGLNTLYLTNGIQTGNGCIKGINLETNLGNIFKGIIEGVTYPLKGVVDQLSRYNGKEFEYLRIGGGGAKSEKWLQLKADMFGIQVEKAKNIEVSSLGAVIMAAVSLGYFNSIEAAINEMVKVDLIFNPRKEIKKEYEKRYKEYLSLII